MNLERETPSAAHWPEQHYEHVFQPAADGCVSERYAWLVEEDRIPQPMENLETQHGVLGFLIARRMKDEWELENVVVSRLARRQGLGILLVTQLLAYAREAHASSIFLEVRESNQAARALYEKFGFEKSGLREDYYSGPQGNAVLYQLRIC